MNSEFVKNIRNNAEMSCTTIDTLRECVDVLSKELIQLKELQERGLLIQLPCPINSTVYILEKNCFDCPNQAVGDNGCFPNRGCLYEVIETEFKFEMLEEFGQTVFLNQQEAEKKRDELNSKIKYL